MPTKSWAIDAGEHLRLAVGRCLTYLSNHFPNFTAVLRKLYSGPEFITQQFIVETNRFMSNTEPDGVSCLTIFAKYFLFFEMQLIWAFFYQACGRPKSAYAYLLCKFVFFISPKLLVLPILDRLLVWLTYLATFLIELTIGNFCWYAFYYGRVGWGRGRKLLSAVHLWIGRSERTFYRFIFFAYTPLKLKMAAGTYCSWELAILKRSTYQPIRWEIIAGADNPDEWRAIRVREMFYIPGFKSTPLCRYWGSTAGNDLKWRHTAIWGRFDVRYEQKYGVYPYVPSSFLPTYGIDKAPYWLKYWLAYWPWDQGYRGGNFTPNYGLITAVTEADTLSNLRYSILFTLALSSLTVYSIVLAGWSSNSKYAFLGALRSAAQMISYEVSISLVIVPVVAMAGSLNFTKIVFAQIVTIWYLYPLLPIALVFLVSILAETNRTPFDLPEAEAELVAGYNVDYSSLPFAMFFLGEYANMIQIALVFCLLFLGGWHLCILLGGSPLVLALKGSVLWIFFVLVRATLPRYRYDQLMDIGWKVFLPFAGGFLIFVIGVIVTFNLAPVTHEVGLYFFLAPLT
jgi:formate hydrogenlyase subunit 4